MRRASEAVVQATGFPKYVHSLFRLVPVHLSASGPAPVGIPVVSQL